jgi:hypothetical protein
VTLYVRPAEPLVIPDGGFVFGQIIVEAVGPSAGCASGWFAGAVLGWGIGWVFGFTCALLVWRVRHSSLKVALSLLLAGAIEAGGCLLMVAWVKGMIRGLPFWEVLIVGIEFLAFSAAVLAIGVWRVVRSRRLLRARADVPLWITGSPDSGREAS